MYAACGRDRKASAVTAHRSDSKRELSTEDLIASPGSILLESTSQSMMAYVADLPSLNSARVSESDRI